MDMGISAKVIETVFSAQGLLAFASGMLVGYIIGILPAVGQGFALILLMPLAFLTRPEIAFIVYASMFGGADLGGSVTSILLNVPGNAANVTTILDGYPMARAGHAGRAIGLSAGSSIIGSVVGVGILVSLMPLMKLVMYNFGAREYFLAILLAMIIAALASGQGRFAKGLAAACLGMLFAFVGTDVVFGKLRYTMGISYLTGGLPIIALVIGLYAVSELLILQSEGESIAEGGIANARLSDTLQGVAEAFRNWPAVIRASFVGVLVGCVPGLGGSVAQYASYGVAKMMAKDKSMFGKGDPIGVIASEASNNARDGACMLPTLFLGIPGGPEMAILLGIFLIFGITPGPGMAMQHMNLVWIIIICLMLGNVAATILSIFGAPFISKITTLPIVLVSAFTLPLCFASLFSADTEVWDFVIAGALGLIGIAMKRTGYPLAPAIIGYVLAPLAERSFHTVLQSSFYDPLAFFQSRLAIGLTVAIVFAAVMPGVFAVRKVVRNRKGLSARAFAEGLPPDDDLPTRPPIGTERLCVAAVLLILAILITFTAPQYGFKEAGLWPLFVGLLMTLSAAVVVTSEIRAAFKNGTALFGKRDFHALKREWGILFPSIAWTIGYIILTVITGIHVANLVGVFLLLWLLGRMSPVKSAVWSIVVHGCIFLFFGGLFKIILWPGTIPSIIPNLIGGGSLRVFF
jgi:putative tricarboxylic transport membrane protein